MKFEVITALLAKTVIENDKAYDALTLLGIDATVWPEGLARNMMLEYPKLRQEQDHQYAHWKLTQGLAFDRLIEMTEDQYLPNDESIVRVEYQQALNARRTQDLIVNLSREPERARELASLFLNDLPMGVEVFSAEEKIDEHIEVLERERAEGRSKVAIPHWPVLSDKIGGFNPGRLGVLMADSGFGKTNIATQLGMDASESMGVLYVNMEMSRRDFMNRMIAAATATPYVDIFSGRLNWELVRSVMSRKRFRFTDGKPMTLDSIKALARSIKNRVGLGLIIIDYDQKILLPESARQEWKMLQDAAVELDNFSRDIDAYILLLAQTNFEGGLSGSKRMTFPAHQLIHFARDEEGQVYLRAIKNRYGAMNAMVNVEYKPEQSTVREQGAGVWVAKKKRTF